LPQTFIYSGTVEDIRANVKLMRELGIKRLVMNGVEIELTPEPRQILDVEPMEPQGVFAEETGAVCKCGHSWATEHVDAGCLHGCSHALCGGEEPNV
jgi:hypothetical protein